MQNMNKVILSGYLGADPEQRDAGESKKATHFSIAVNHRWTDGGGTRHERVNWIPITAWNSVGENAAKYLKKGSHVLIEGSLRISQYEKNDENRTRIEVVASSVIFLDKKSD